MLQGSRIALRQPQPSDATPLYRWENDPAVWLAGEDGESFSLEQIRDFIRSCDGNNLREFGQQRWMIAGHEHGEAIGTLDLFEYNARQSRAGIGILIGEEKNRRRGLATEALSVFMPYAFKDLQLAQLWCLIAPHNTASLRLFEKQGFERTGEKKQWVRNGSVWEDRYFYQCMAL